MSPRRLRTRRPRAAATLLEVLIALAVLAVALIPIVRHGGRVHRQTFEAEYRTLGMARARFLIRMAEAMDFDVLYQIATDSTSAGGSRPVNLDAIFHVGSLQGPRLTALFDTPDPRTTGILEALNHGVTLSAPRRDLVQVDIRVFWSLPDQPDRIRHIELRRLLHRPDASMILGDAP